MADGRQLEYAAMRQDSFRQAVIYPAATRQAVQAQALRERRGARSAAADLRRHRGVRFILPARLALLRQS
jgi:hypothetical protein